MIKIKTDKSRFKLYTLFAVAVLMLSSCSGSEKNVSVESELYRLRTTDHMFLPQDYKLKQYSGFHRKGLNPDRMHCLYKEDGWRVVTDHKGKGVVSRIWTTYHKQGWGDIKVEVDGTVIYEGNARGFFNQDKLPFVKPLSVIRYIESETSTMEGESWRNEWAVSYVPIPFEKRFRFLQREVVYANINIKEFSNDTPVKSFLKTDWNRVKTQFKMTADVWSDFPLPIKDKNYNSIKKSVKITPADTEKKSVVKLSEIDGSGIIRGIKLKVGDDSVKSKMNLCIYWDGEEQPSIKTPLLNGFGSFNERTMALGKTRDNWQFIYLPAPFRKEAKITIESLASQPVLLDYELIYEKVNTLPEDVLYLRSLAKEGLFRSKIDTIGKQHKPFDDFFYRVGFNVLDYKGAGHIAAYTDLFFCQPELDEHIFIDDERVFPNNSWNGTGHEDLFDMAWGHKPLSSPMTSGGSQDFKEVNVKLFWNDLMPFKKAIKFNWEWSYKYGIEPPRDAKFASVVYWYSKP